MAAPTISPASIQSIITKHKLMDQPIVVVNKGGGSGAEGYVYGKSANAGDPYKLIFGTNNAYLLPYVAKLGYKFADLTPVAALALDEFLLWVNGEAPYTDAKSFSTPRRPSPMGFKMGGSQSKDTDQTLTCMIQDATGAKFIYVPFKGGGEAAVQLAGGHIDANVNNPNENIGQWKAGRSSRSASSRQPVARRAPRSRATGLGRHPDLQGSGPERRDLPDAAHRLAAGRCARPTPSTSTPTPEKVSKTPEWKEYIERTVPDRPLPDRRGDARLRHQTDEAKQPQGLREGRLGRPVRRQPSPEVRSGAIRS